MALYRLDYIDTEGNVTGPVRGRDLGILPTGDVLTRHMSKARERAIQAANRAECDVQITGIVKSGILKPRLILDRHGRARKPLGTRAARDRDDCKRGTGQTCFCPPCRAERKASR